MRRTLKAPAASRELVPGQSAELLKELHLLTRTGDLNADSLRKLKQVNHLVRLLAPALEDVLSRFGDPVLVDCGAGKSYLGFILYELFLREAGKGTLVSVETRAELTRAAEERARRLGYERMRFVTAALDEAQLPSRIHLVTALHACDTATDDALALAIRSNADHVAAVPCCQAEVARQLERAAPHGRGPDGVASGEDAGSGDEGADSRAGSVLATLHRHAWHRREFGSHLTNVIRVLVLEARGYRVTVTELTGWEHSLKNELILGRKVRARSATAERQLWNLVEATGVRPKLVRILEGGAPGAP